MRQRNPRLFWALFVKPRIVGGKIIRLKYFQATIGLAVHFLFPG